MNYTQLTEKKKVEIDILLKQGMSMRKVAKILGISHSTISRYKAGIYKKRKIDITEKYKIFIDYLYPSYFFSKCNEYIILISSLLVFCTITISCRSNLRWYVANR